MTFAPPDLAALNTYWKAQGGVASGIVGDASHQLRPSYHNGQDVIAAHGRTAANDYTIRPVRDGEPGLTNASSGIDLGRLNGSLGELRKFSAWFVERCRAGHPDYLWVREVIYAAGSPADVFRWDQKRGQGSEPRNDIGGDDSHLWHTHISAFRDSRDVDKVPSFRAYFEQGEPMGMTFTLPASPLAGTVRIPLGTEAIRVSDASKYIVPINTSSKPAYGVISAGGSAGFLVDLQGDVAHFVYAAGVAFTPTPGPTDCSVAVLEGKRAQYDADFAAANADPIQLGPRP